MEWIIENWYLLVAVIVATCGAVYAIYRFFGMPSQKQVEKIKEWMIWACIEAERILQSGTGKLKLREVWDMFCSVPAFTWIAKIISFEQFEYWLAEALIEAKKMLAENKNLAIYVYGVDAEEEVDKLKKQIESVELK